MKRPKKKEKKKYRKILLKLHDIGGCDAADGFSKGWDAAISEAISIIEKEAGLHTSEWLY